MSDKSLSMRLYELCEELSFNYQVDLVDAAADEIERLSAENERTKEQCAREHKSREHWIAVAQRLEAALEEIANQKLSCQLIPGDVDFEGGYDCCVKRARKALEPVSEEPAPRQHDAPPIYNALQDAVFCPKCKERLL